MEKEKQWLLREKYNNQPTKKFYNDLKRIDAGEPVDYVIGFTEFLSCKIDLSKKPLIPRPDTEFWVLSAIEEIKKKSQTKIKVLDIFSGSGCIGVALLKNVPSLLCDFSDIERNNVKQIKINLKINKINKKRFKVIQSDIFEKIKSKYDFILANPPYVAQNLKNKLQKSVLDYEPKVALFSGRDGLWVIKKFLAKAKNYLNINGLIFMEFSPEQKKEIETIIIKNRYTAFKFYKDQNERWRWVSIAR